MIRLRYVRILFHRELLRFLANPALWVLLLLFFCMGFLISISDVILQRDTFNIVVHNGQPSDFLEFVEQREPNITLFTPREIRNRKGVNRQVYLRLSEDFDQRLAGGKTPIVKIASLELSNTDLERLHELLVQDAFLYLKVPVPLDVKLFTLTGGARTSAPQSIMQSLQATEDFKSLIMALLITISLNILCFNIFTVTFTEEKQNQTLLAVLLTPARNSEVAVAKGLFFMIPGLALAASLTGVYRPDILSSPVLWITLLSGALLYMSIALVLVSFVEKQSTATLLCLGYLFFLSSMFILAPRFTALYPIKNHLPENFIFSILSFLFDGTPFFMYKRFFYSFVAVSLVAPFVAMSVFNRRMSCKPPEKRARESGNP